MEALAGCTEAGKLSRKVLEAFGGEKGDHHLLWECLQSAKGWSPLLLMKFRLSVEVMLIA